MKKLSFLLLVCQICFLTAHSQVYKPDGNGIFYVDSASTVDPADYNWIGDGWPKAISNLSDALRAADSINSVNPGMVKQIWVAKGTYKPKYGPIYQNSNDQWKADGRNNTFTLLNNVKIYGGFSGIEHTLEQRDTTKLFTSNRTILSGDLGKKGDITDNAYHVVVAIDQYEDNAQLDGFVITGGNATGVNNQGGGLFLFISSPTISNCILTKNRAHAGGGLYNNSNSTKIVNTIFTENSARLGAGAFFQNSEYPILSHCTFSGNSTTSGSATGEGGGVYNFSSYPAFSNCMFTGNHAGDGGAIFNNKSAPVVTNSILSGNVSSSSGGGIYNSDSYGTYTNCLISNNKAKDGGAISIYNSSEFNNTELMKFLNCTITNNFATNNGGSIYSSIGYGNFRPLSLINCILWGNSSSIYPENLSSLTLSHSIVQSADMASKGTANLNKDPLFVNANAGNYQLKPGSPAFNRGTIDIDNSLKVPSEDLAGNARISDIYLDMGAYEIQSPDTSGILYVNKNVTAGLGNGASWTNAFKELSDALLVAEQLNKVQSGTVKQIWVARGTYYPLYSAQDVHRTEDGGPNNAFVLVKDVKIYGGFVGSEASLAQRDSTKLFTDNFTELDGLSPSASHHSYHVVIAAGNLGDAEINGFSITNGYALGLSTELIKVNGQNIPGDAGGGLYNKNGQVNVRHCKFYNDYSNVGGAFSSENGSFTIAFCDFEENHAISWGGAIYSKDVNTDYTSLITKSSFVKNYISTTGTQYGDSGGGAIYNEEGNSLKISYCTFKENHTPTASSHGDEAFYVDGGAIFNLNSSPKITHCSFIDNTSSFAGAVYNRGSSPIITHCSFVRNEAVYKGYSNLKNGGFGGAIYNSSSSTHIINCSFSNNVAYQRGGAIANNYENSSVLIAGCLFTGNHITGGEVASDFGLNYIGEDIFSGTDVKVSIINCTIITKKWHIIDQYDWSIDSRNANASSCKIINSIVWGWDKARVSSENKVSYSIIQQPSGQTFDGDGNLNRDPLFMDPANGDYSLKKNSPAIAGGLQSVVQQYHLPDSDLAGNPLVIDGKINMGAYGSTFVHPTNLTATYDGRDTVNVSWQAPLKGDEAYVSGDNFKLERSTDSTFQSNVKTITSTIKYQPDKKDYTISDDITDLSGGLTLYYRLTRTKAQNQDWQRPAYDTAQIHLITQLKGIQAKSFTASDGTVKAEITWKPFTGLWPSGTQFNLIKKNKTDGTQQSISIEEDSARAGHYIDDNIPTCKEIRYFLSVKLGNHYSSPAQAEVPDSILTKKLATISNLVASKGYYPDRTTLRWSTSGSYDHYVIKRKVYGSSEQYAPVSTIDGTGLKNVQADDDKGTPGVYYQYAITGLAQCSDVTLYSDTLHAIGFRSPTGTVYGRVTYDKGGGAVNDVSVRMENQDNKGLGGSVYLDGQHDSRLVLNSMTTDPSDSDFTVSVWIKPMNKTPKNQIIFTREGQYTLGFNNQGQLYFEYNGQKITGSYVQDILNGWSHITGVHKKDSLFLLLHTNDTCMISRKIIPFKASQNVSQRVYIGSNSDGSNYNGYLDEMRLWNIARDSLQVAKDYSRLLTGGEKGLIAYWRFDASVKGLFFDLAHNGDTYHMNNGTMDSLHDKRSDVIPSTDQLSLRAYTDSTGNYTIAGIPYYGINGTTYTIAPMLGTHSFDPISVSRIFSSGSNTFTLDFKDKSSYSVSGTITYFNTNVPVQGVQFKVDGNYAYNGNGGIAQTNSKGEFTISVPVGVHEVQAVKANHVFVNDGKILVNGHDVNYQQDVAGIPIYDSTTIRFIGRVAGGPVQSNLPLGFSLSKNILGANMSITLTSQGQRFLNTTGKTITKYYRHVLYTDQQGERIKKLPDSTKVTYYKNKIVIYPDTTTGEFEAELIPADFLISQDNGVVVKGYKHAPLNSSVNLNLTDSLIEKNIIDSLTDSTYDITSHSMSYTTSYDTVKYNASYMFTYNVDPVVTVQQAMGPGNPNTVNYFGNLTYTFTNVLGDKTEIPAYNKEKKEYTFGLPVFKQGTAYTLKIQSFQRYPYYDTNGKLIRYSNVPSRGGKVMIHNEISDETTENGAIKLDSSGVAYYTFYAGTPELVKPNLKGFSVSVQIGKEIYQWNNGMKQEAYVFGGVADGNDFVTAGPNEKLGILRDPPGSNSYAYLDKNFTFNHTSERTQRFDNVGSAGAYVSFIPEFEASFGTPFFKKTSSAEPILHLTTDFVHEEHLDTTNIESSSTTILTGIKTSNDPSFDGASDDIFIGNSTNITYGQSRVLCAVPSSTIQNTDILVFGGKGKTKYAIVEREGFHSGQTFGTMYIYPQSYVVKYLIPNLVKIRNKILAKGTSYSNPQTVANNTKQEVYVSLLDTSNANYGVYNLDTTIWQPKGMLPTNGAYSNGPSYVIYFPLDAQGNIIKNLVQEDTIMILDQHINGWKNWLKENEKAKVTADYNKNYSFGAGSSLDISEQKGSTYKHEEHYSYVVGMNIVAQAGALIDKAGTVATITNKATYTSDTLGTDDTLRSRTIGFHLEEGGSNYISVSKGDDANGFPVYQTKGGVTSCPYEDSSTTKYYQPGTLLNQKTIQREEPEIKVIGRSVVTGVADNRPAVFKLKLQNASSVKGDIYFGLKVIDKSNPYGAKIFVDGTPLGNGRTILIPSGDSVIKTLTVEKGPDSMNYDNIEVVLHSMCQYNPQVYSQNIFSEVKISAHFKPGCSDIHLSSPKDKWLLNTLSPEIVKEKDTIRYLPVTLDQYDLNKNLFNHVALQYKSANSSEWITQISFFTDSAHYKKDKQGGDKRVIQSSDETDYQFLMGSNFADGEYDIRALSVCMDNGKVVAQTPSNIVSGIKDTYRPRPFGNPQPANGILGVGQDAEIKFNEPIDIGYLNQQTASTFFTVRGVKNGTAIDSTVAIQLDGQKDDAETEFNKNMTGKDFTVAMWIMPDQKKGGTLFSQGNRNNSVELALTNDYHLQAIVGNKTYTSSRALKYLPGQWVHLALEYDAQDSTVSAFYNANKVLSGNKASQYKGIGPFIFGKSLKNSGNFFAGKMRNVRVWTENLSSIQLQENSVKTLSGGENHLLACYPMNEGKGQILHDVAHGNNATFTGDWKMPEGMSIAFDGNGYVRLNTGQAVITPEMDFTLGLWFKAVPGQTNATLISNGKGDGKDLDGSKNLYSLGFVNGKLSFYNNSYGIQIDGNYLDNNWHHVAIAVDRNTGTAKFYVDGQLKKFFNADNLGGLASSFTYVGARAYHEAPDSTVTHFDQYFKGNIDGVRIWNTYLNSTLISKNGNTRLSGKETGLLAYYPFEMHKTSTSGIGFTSFTLADQKIQKDTSIHIPDAVLTNATESAEKAPMKDPGPEQNLSYDFVANNDAIKFNFSGGAAEMKAIDKTIVTITATNIKDLHGNYMASPVTWTAYIDQNPLSWSDEKLNLSKKVNKPMQFESYIINSGGSEENFNLDNLPAWLTADVTGGTVPPEGKQKITFTINSGLNVGSYDDIIEMTNDLQETQGLEINLKVIGQTPDWEVNPSDFRYNMTVYGKIRVDGIFSSDPEDMLAAFRKGKCIGVVHNAYFEANDLWYSFLTIYSNDKDFDAKELSFRIWDASTGKVYTGVPSQTFSFKNGAIQGTPAQPVIFDGVNLIFQNIDLQKGWNWLSFNVKNPVSEEVNTVLANGQWSSEDVIKLNNNGFASYSVMTHQWVPGKLQKFDNRFSYMLKTGIQQKLSTGGAPIDVTTMAIPVNGHSWNYISYLPQRNMTLKEALADYHATDEDVIKSQTGFAMYDARLGWVGNLTYLEPGKGYMLYSNASIKDSFYYPQLQGILRKQDNQLNDVRIHYPNLDFSQLNYMELPVKNNFAVPENMTVVASIGTGISAKSGDKIAAFEGDQLAGKALAIQNPVTHHSAFFFNLSGRPGQPVYFKLLRDGKEIAETSPELSWSANKMIGSLKAPLKLYFEKSFFQAQLYPNPFDQYLDIQIRMDTHKRHRMDMEIYNVSGQIVYAKKNISIINGFYETNWDGQAFNGTACASGIYFLHLKVDQISHVYKVVKQ